MPDRQLKLTERFVVTSCFRKKVSRPNYNMSMISIKVAKIFLVNGLEMYKYSNYLVPLIVTQLYLMFFRSESTCNPGSNPD